MPNRRLKHWTEDDIAKLKSLAGKLSTSEIAAELGRSLGATAVEASKLKISLRRGYPRTTEGDVERDMPN